MVGVNEDEHLMCPLCKRDLAVFRNGRLYPRRRVVYMHPSSDRVIVSVWCSGHTVHIKLSPAGITMHGPTEKAHGVAPPVAP